MTDHYLFGHVQTAHPCCRESSPDWFYSKSLDKQGEDANYYIVRNTLNLEFLSHAKYLLYSPCCEYINI